MATDIATDAENIVSHFTMFCNTLVNFDLPLTLVSVYVALVNYTMATSPDVGSTALDEKHHLVPYSPLNYSYYGQGKNRPEFA